MRNVLEELEELEIFGESLEVCTDDMRLSDQIGRTCKLLQRLDFSLRSYQCSQNKTVDEDTVSDFKTDLDVMDQELTTTYETMSTGEIPLKLDTRDIPAFASPVSKWDSTSPSAVESAHERRPSSHTSSAWSTAVRESLGNRINPSPLLQDAPVDEWQPSEEKEVYDLDPSSMESPNTRTIATATTPSLDWRSPFASPDPMSISIEEASNMILRDDDMPTPFPATPKSPITPQSSFNTRPDIPQRSSERQLLSGLGITPEQRSIEPSNAQAETMMEVMSRPRAASECVQPIWQKSSAGQIESTSSKLHATRSHDSFNRVPIRRLSGSRIEDKHLSPNAIVQDFGRRSRNNSAASITFSTRSVDTGDPTSDGYAGRSSVDGVRKDLSVVLESESDDEAYVAPGSQSEYSDGNQQSTTLTDDEPRQPPPSPTRKPPPPPPPRKLAPPVPSRKPPPLPPPPARTPPSPPKQTRVPKIPKRSPTYRVVNATQPDESSSDEDGVYASSKPSSSVASDPPLNSQVEGQQAPHVSTDAIALANSTSREPEEKPSRLRGRSKTTHAQRVLMVRSQYTPPTSTDSSYNREEYSPSKTLGYLPKLSMQNLHVRRHSSEVSPSLKRHSISELPSRELVVKFEEHVTDAMKVPGTPNAEESQNQGMFESYSSTLR